MLIHRRQTGERRIPIKIIRRLHDHEQPGSQTVNLHIQDPYRTDSFRYLYPDKTGAYSWWSYRFHAREKNAGWRIDYFIVSRRIADRIRAAEIHNEIFGSDHCPVELQIDL